MPRKRPPPGSRFSAGHGPTVHLPAFVAYLESECQMAANTVRAYAADLERFCGWYGKHGPDRLNRLAVGHLTDYMQHLQEAGLASTSVARHLVSIKMFLRYLVLEGVLVESQAELLNSPKLWQKLPKVLSPEAVDRLLAAPSHADRYRLRDRAILAMMYATGCRASEVTGLKLDDVHLDGGWCRCTGKGDKQRIVHLNPVAIAAVEAYLSYERNDLTSHNDEGWLFVSRSGRSLSRIDVWNLLKRYAARAGLDAGVSPHTLRHSFATHMLAGGAEIRALQELLGHASIRTTQIYTHVEHSRLKAVHRECHPRG